MSLMLMIEGQKMLESIKMLQEAIRQRDDHIKRLEDAGNRLKDRYILENENWDLQTVNDWNDAKEAKP